MKLLCWLFSCVLSSIFCLSHSCCPVSLLALKEKALNSFFVFFQLYALRLSAIIQPVISSLRNICVHVYTEFSISQRLLNPFSLLSFSLTTTGSEKGRRTIKHSNIECNERPLKPWNEILLTCHSRPKKKPSAFICVCWHKNLKTHTQRVREREEGRLVKLMIPSKQGGWRKRAQCLERKFFDHQLFGVSNGRIWKSFIHSKLIPSKGSQGRAAGKFSNQFQWFRLIFETVNYRNRELAAPLWRFGLMTSYNIAW